MTTLNDEVRSLYWQIGKKAVKDGILTDEELRIICRLGHRKEGYWNRHLLDLIDVIGDRAGLDIRE